MFATSKQNFIFISGCGAVGSAGGLGPSGRRFEPCHSDQNSKVLLKRSTFEFNMSFICALIYLFSALSFTVTKKFNHGLETKVEMKGTSLMVLFCTCVIGILVGSATTVCAGGCSQIA